MTNENEWRMNDGTVPEGVGPNTVIEVEYRNGDVMTWYFHNDYPVYWTIDNHSHDVIRWRFV